MRKTLINLTRFGDLLQTQPIIEALGRQGHEVSLVCLENFAGAAGLLTGVRQVATLPGAKLLASLENDWRLCLQTLEQWLDGQEEECSPVSVLNLTPALASRLLSRLLQGKGQPEGFSLDEYGFGCNSTLWATYVQAVTLRRGCSPFNLVDGFRQMAGVGGLGARYALAEPAPELVRDMETMLADKRRAAGLPERSALVGFQLGASRDARRWPTGAFAELGRILLDQAGLVPVLLGNTKETELAARYAAAGGPGLDLTGKTDLPHLAAGLRLCRLLVSNDTGTMHLAAGLNVPVLGIFLATAQPWDTGPYQEGMCCLEPRLDCHPCSFSTVCPHDGACRAIIRGRDAAALILGWLEHGRWPDFFRAEDSPGARARIWLSARDERGFMDLRSLSGDEGSDRTVWIRLQRDFYRRFLDSMDPEAPVTEPSAESPAEQSANRAELSPEFRDRVLAFLEQADGLLLLAAEQGRLLSIRPTDNARTGLLATTDRIGRYFDASQDFVPLAFLWRGMVQDFAGNWTQLLSFFQILRRHLHNLANKIR